MIWLMLIVFELLAIHAAHAWRRTGRTLDATRHLHLTIRFRRGPR